MGPAIFSAIQAQDLKQVKSLLKEDKSGTLFFLFEEGRPKHTPLYAATKGQSTRIVKALLKRAAKLELNIAKQCNHCLKVAVKINRASMAHLICPGASDPHPAFERVIRSNDYHLFDVLFKNEFDPGRVHTIVQKNWGIIQFKSLERIQRNLSGAHEITFEEAFCEAIDHKNIGLFQELIEKGIVSVDEEFPTMLEKNVELFPQSVLGKILYRYNRDVDEIYEKMAFFALEKGAYPNSWVKPNKSLLMQAVLMKKESLALTLLRKGAHLFEFDQRGIPSSILQKTEDIQGKRRTIEEHAKYLRMQQVVDVCKYRMKAVKKSHAQEFCTYEKLE